MKLQVYKKVDVAGVLRLEIPAPQFAGKDVTVTIEKTKRKRSTQQNRYYWKCVIPIIQAELIRVTGENVEELTVHELLKQRFNSKTIVNPKTGETIQIPISTTELNTIDFELFLEDCRKFCAEFFDVQIPLPNEQSQLNYTT